MAIGGLALSLPWWAHRRRRARVRVERKLEAWPDIARAVGLTGSQVMSATVGVWGWRARLRLARGQTIADVTARIPALESGLGTFRGAVRVYPTPDDLANRCELRVLNTDPHADAALWPGPSVTSITEPIELGPFEDATPCRVLFLRRHGNAHALNAPGKFLVSAPEHSTPKRARGYLVTDQAVSDTAAEHADSRPELDEISRRPISPVPQDDEPPDSGDLIIGHVGESSSSNEPTAAEDALWLALTTAPDQGCDIGELLHVTGMSRPTLYRYLAQLAKSGRAVQVSRGRWSAPRQSSHHRE
jgi:hypothetical protein